MHPDQPQDQQQGRQLVLETCDFLNSHFQESPVIGLLTGTGLSDSLTNIHVTAQIDYCDIPHFPQSTVESHKGKMIFGSLHGKNIIG